MEPSAQIREREGGFMAQHRSFQPTQPGIVKGAGRGDRTALSLLCRWYWYPIYSFLRHLGTGPLDAGDVTQGFFARMLEPEGLQDLAKVDLRRARFRCWLKACARYYLLNELDRARTKKRGGGWTAVDVDASTAEERFQMERCDSRAKAAAPGFAGIIDRELALIVVERALARLQERCRSVEMRLHVDEMRRGIRRTAIAADDGDEALAARLGTTAGNLRKNRSQVRKRFRALLREEVGALVDDPASIDDELRHLRDAL